MIVFCSWSSCSSLQEKPHLTRGLEAQPNISREPLLFLLLAPSKQHCLVVLKDRSLLLVSSLRLHNSNGVCGSLSTPPFPRIRHRTLFSRTITKHTYLLSHLFFRERATCFSCCILIRMRTSWTLTLPNFSLTLCPRDSWKEGYGCLDSLFQKFLFAFATTQCAAGEISYWYLLLKQVCTLEVSTT